MTDMLIELSKAPKCDKPDDYFNNLNAKWDCNPENENKHNGSDDMHNNNAIN